MTSISGYKIATQSYYRPDIDGLRALAILPVLLFHLDYSSFSGGYIGVDVFFVISGYLITSLLLRDFRCGTFSIGHFYERRARRLLPALFVVLACSLVTAYLLFLPKDFMAFSRALIATVFSVSNIYFWQKAGSYFDDSANTNAVIHSWSLSLEEQFYLLLPIFLLIVLRFCRSWLQTFLWAIFVFSLAVSIYAVEFHPKAAFYLLPTRAWELALGAMAAASCIQLPQNKKLHNIVLFIGLLAIIAPVFLFKNTTAVPGYNALFPCLGAAFVILAGQNGYRSGFSSVLTWRPLVFIGLISYSLYLWHWPLIVFFKYYNIHLLSHGQKLVIFGLSIMLAILSWRFIEQPFRRRGTGRFSTAITLACSLAAALGLSTLSWLVIQDGGLPQRFPSGVLEMAQYANSTNEKSKLCSLRPSMTQLPGGRPCVYGAEVEPKYAIWGDSHADALVAMLGELGQQTGSATVAYIYHSCAVWLRGYVENNDSAKNCAKFRLNTLAALQRTDSIETVFIVSRWVLGMRGSPSGFGPAENHAPSRLMNDKDRPLASLQHRKQHLYQSMMTIVRQLVAAGKKIVVVHPIPEAGYNIPRDLALLRLRGEDPTGVLRRPYDFYLQRQLDIIEVLESLPRQHVSHIRPAERFCDASHCLTFAANKPLYHDDDHLSLEGARYLAPLFSRYLQPAAYSD